MKIESAFEKLQEFKDILEKNDSGMAFTLNIVEQKNAPFSQWFREEVPGIGASQSSGIYFISDVDRNILYIGKAGAGNLGAEIWGKFGAPNQEGLFYNSPLAKWAPKDRPELAQLIITGNFLVSAAVIEPKEFASLAEVYLHVWCAVNGGLPAFNKRIG